MRAGRFWGADMDIEDWLRSLGLEEYEAAFKENAIDASVLPTLTAEDLKDLGVGLVGHRRKLLDAISALRARVDAREAVPVSDRLSEGSAERRQVTVMFTDLVGSTALSARMDPEDLRTVMGAHHRCVAETVARFDGFVAKYMGDGALIYFGYPAAHEDDAERAVRAGLALIDAVASLDAPEPLRVRVGVATGLVVVGDLVGSGEAQERGIVGEAPNLASRLQGIAEPNTVVIADGTRRLLGNLFELQDLGTKDLKGIAEPVRAWATLRASSVESRFEAMHAGGLTALVGREEELELLLRRWTRAKVGEGQVVLISGEPGIGKSRLTAALLEHLAEPHTRLRYFCSPQHTDSAFYSIISQFERAAGFAHGDTPQAKLDKLDALLAQTTTSKHDALLLAEMLSLPNDGRYPALELAPEQRRQKTLEALSLQMETLARSSPVLMIFEDAHWSDPTSLEAFGRVVDRVRSLRVLLIVTFRPEFAAPWIGQPHVTALTLNRLGQRDVGAMVDRVVGNKLLPPSIRQDIIERTDGIPLFVEEITKAVLEADSEGEARRDVAAIPSPTLAVPASLHASLMARLDRLGSAKEIAQVGAAIGRELSHALLAAVASKPDAELASALDRLVGAGLLFRQGAPPHASYLFKHALVQDVAYSTLLRSRRQQLHSRIATTLEREFPEIAATQPELLAQHHVQAGETEAAIKFWTIAGDLAERRAMSREAVAHYRAAAALVSSPAATAIKTGEPGLLMKLGEPGLLMKLGNALQQVEGYNSDSALEAYQGARAAARVLGQFEDYAKASIGMAPLLFGRNHYRQVLEIGGEVSGNYLDKLGPHSRVILLTMLACANFGLGEFVSAWEQAIAACALDDSMPCTHENPVGGGDPAIIARTYAILSGCALGHFDRCLTFAEESLAIARERNHPFTIAWAHLSAARFYNSVGRFKDALLSGNEAIEICERHGFFARLGVVLLWTGAAYCGVGETERGLAEFRRGLDLWRKTSGQFHMSSFLTMFADCLVRAQRYEELDLTLREVEQIVRETDEQSGVGELLRLRGVLLALRGNAADGVVNLWQAVEWSRSRSTKLFELRALRDLVLLDLSERRSEEAVVALQQLLASFPEELETPELREARRLLHDSTKGSR
jgi:class 3 adenylate cyclase/tetratricopeptide (TPR) repeat protein